MARTNQADARLSTIAINVLSGGDLILFYRWNPSQYRRRTAARLT